MMCDGDSGDSFIVCVCVMQMRECDCCDTEHNGDDEWTCEHCGSECCSDCRVERDDGDWIGCKSCEENQVSVRLIL